MKPIDRARLMYEQNGRNFDAILADHLCNGIVVASPMWFLMLRAIEWENELVWFVEIAIGNLKDLSRLIAVRLPKIAFCRVKNGRKQTKVYATDRLLRLAQREI